MPTRLPSPLNYETPQVAASWLDNRPVVQCLIGFGTGLALIVVSLFAGGFVLTFCATSLVFAAAFSTYIRTPRRRAASAGMIVSIPVALLLIVWLCVSLD